MLIAVPANMPKMAQEYAEQTTDPEDDWSHAVQFILLPVLIDWTISGGPMIAASLSGTASRAIIASIPPRRRRRTIMIKG